MRKVVCGRGVAVNTKGFACGVGFASRCIY